MSDDERLTYSVRETASLLGTSVDLVYDLIAAGRLPHVRLGRRIVIPRGRLIAWVEAGGPENGEAAEADKTLRAVRPDD